MSRGSHIAATAVNSGCVAELVYTATLVRSDSVMFEYQKDDRSQIFTFEVCYFCLLVVCLFIFNCNLSRFFNIMFGPLETRMNTVQFTKIYLVDGLIMS